MDLSVVICTLDRRESLLRALASLAEQEADARWEVVVVDNGGADGSAEAAARADLAVPVRAVVESRRGLSRARNRGLSEAAGAVCAFADDDMTFRPGWVAAYAAAFEEAPVGAAGGRIHPVLPPGTPGWFEELMREEVGGPSARYDLGDEPAEITAAGPLPTPFGGNMAVRRELALALGGFRVDLGWGERRVPCEEVEFFGRLLAAGHRVRYCPGAAVDHHVQPEHVTLEYYLRWQEGSGRAGVIMRPPRGRLDRIGKVGTAARHLVRAWWRARRGSLPARREAARMRGRLLELLGR